ncbi:hypothetical protein [Macrococcoides bohemicum]|uniref:hypothetical protein n=1 Tax=Macrococcoides bohemicum TaxID=1903056 RepID=UPI00193FF578|nr:hypothetical protein [Macrococcus bohemicus]QRN49204.1 hypothetical protein HT586_03240 [Macrococcus bohemicus]
MQLKTLSLNKALYSNLSRSIIFLTIINIICTFILVPFSYIIAHLDNNTAPHDHSKYLIGELATMPIYFFGTMAYALLCAAFLTYYFKSQAASDFIHSLPIRRERVLTTVYAVFVSHLLVNLLVNGLITWIIGVKYTSIDIEKIVIWILINLVIDFFVFTITMLFGLFINNMLNHLISSIILIASPLILGTMVYTTHMFMFKGLESYPEKLMMNLTVPFRFLGNIMNDKLDFKYLLIVLIVSIVIFLLNFIIYRKRKNERINEAYATNYAHFIVFFISMLIATLLGGIIFNSIFNEQKLITIFIYIVSFTLIYIFLEMIAQKSVRIQFDRKLYAMTLGLIAVSILGIYISGQMRENYVPEAESVKSVQTSFNENDHLLEDGILSKAAVPDKKFIQDVIDGHKDLVKAKRATANSNTQVPVDITYKMNDGRKINRHYYVDENTFNRYMKNVATKENAETITNYINWDKLMKKSVTLNIETSDNSFAGQDLSERQKELLKPLLIEKYKKSYDEKGDIPFNNTVLNLVFSENDMGFNEDSLYISLYDTEILRYLVKEKLISNLSSALPLGNIYDLGDKSNYKKIKTTQDVDVKQLDFAKKINRNQFKEKFNENGANSNGNHLYYFDGGFQFVLMNN